MLASASPISPARKLLHDIEVRIFSNVPLWQSHFFLQFAPEPHFFFIGSWLEASPRGPMTQDFQSMLELIGTKAGSWSLTYAARMIQQDKTMYLNEEVEGLRVWDLGHVQPEEV